MMEMLQDLEPVVDEDVTITPTRGERMSQPLPNVFADPLAGTPVGAFAYGSPQNPVPAPSGYAWDHDPEDLSDLPDEIAALFTKVEQDEYFTCTPQRQLPNGQLEDALEFKSYRPTRDEIGTKFGPGTWRYLVTYRPKGWSRSKGGRTRTAETPWFHLSEEAYRVKHEEYLAARQDDLNTRLRVKREMNQARFGGSGETNVMEMLTALTGVVRSLQVPAAPPSSGIAEVMPMFMKMSQESADRSQQMMSNMMVAITQSQTQMMTMMMTMLQSTGQASQQMMTAVMQMNNESSNRMVALLGNTNKDSTLSMFKEFKSFVMDGINLSRTANQMLQGDIMADHEPEEREEPNSLVQTILAAIPAVLSSLSVLNAVPAVARPPVINAAIEKEAGAQGRAAYEAMKHDSATRVQSMVGFVREFGPEQLKEVLDAMMVKYTPEEYAHALKVGKELRERDLANAGEDIPVAEVVEDDLPVG